MVYSIFYYTYLPYATALSRLYHTSLLPHYTKLTRDIRIYTHRSTHYFSIVHQSNVPFRRRPRRPRPLRAAITISVRREPRRVTSMFRSRWRCLISSSRSAYRAPSSRIARIMRACGRWLRKCWTGSARENALLNSVAIAMRISRRFTRSWRRIPSDMCDATGPTCSSSRRSRSNVANAGDRMGNVLPWHLRITTNCHTITDVGRPLS